MSIKNNTTSLQSLLDAVNALPEEVILPELSNPADASKALEGYEFINEDGEKITGNIETKTESDLTVNQATVTVPAGYYASQTTKSVTTVTRANTTISVSTDDTNDKLTITASNNQGTGYVTGANKTATKTISLTASGSTVTASDGTNKISKSVTTATQATPSISINSSGLITASATQTAGYVTAGTKSATKQLTVQAAKTITPSSSSQTAVASGRYTTGDVTVAAIPSSYVQLNFTVVGGTSTPSNPSENTIWVNTSTSITSWVVGLNTPESPATGMVWIRESTSSGNSFNALKQNEMQTYPVAVSQYISGAWVNKTGYIYKGNEWIPLFDGYIIKDGYFQWHVVSEWGMYAYNGSNHATFSEYPGNGYVALISPEGTYTSFTSHETLPTSSYNTLYIDYSAQINGYSVDEFISIGGITAGVGTSGSLSRYTRAIDISGLTSDYRLSINGRAWMGGSSNYIYIYNIWLA